MSKIDPLTTITSGFNSTAQLNSNFTKITAALNNTLSRDGSSPNQMDAVIDMNSNRIINLADPVDNQDAVTLVFFNTNPIVAADIAAAAASATAAAISETNAAASENSLIRYTFDISTSMADPGVGDFRYNNAIVSSVTAIAFDASMAQTGNPDVSDYIVTFDDSTSAIAGHLILSKRGNAEIFAVFTVSSVTDNTGWLQVTVSHVSSSGTFSATDAVDIAFTRTGNIGAAFVKTDITGQAAATVATGDSFVFTDIGDSDNLKKDTIQGILDLVSTDLAGKADTAVVAADKFTFYDAGDSDNPKTDTVQGLIDLIAGEATQDYLAGLVLSNDIDNDHDINIVAGQAADSTNAKSLTLPTEITKQIDAAWIAGNDVGGLFSGAVSANTTYHIFIIEKDTDSSIDAGFDTSVTAANIPAGYTKFRRIGSIVTDSSSNIINGTWLEGGDFFLLKTPILDVDTAALGTSATTFVLSSPINLKLKVFLNCAVKDDTNDAAVYVSSLDSDDQAASGNVSPLSTLQDDNTAAGGISQIHIFTNTSSQIRARSNQTPDSFRLALLGWKDTRGK